SDVTYCFFLSLQDSEHLESTLNILNVLDELLSAGTDRRIHYMIAKGGSEALLTALVSAARAPSPNFSMLVPVMHLLAKVGHRDRNIGQKAEKMEAVLLTLDLLRQNVKHARRAAACLWLLQVFLWVKHWLSQNIKTCYANSRCAVAKGYISGLLRLYEDWHHRDMGNGYVTMCKALLRCLQHATNTSAARAAVVAEGGMGLLFHTTQSCLDNKGLESLVDAAVQLMRKCYPKCPVPLRSGYSAYMFPLPGRPVPDCIMTSEPQGKPCLFFSALAFIEYSPCRKPLLQWSRKLQSTVDDDLETDLKKLRVKPEPDRPMEELGQYVELCPELHCDFQVKISAPRGLIDQERDGLTDHLRARDLHNHYLNSYKAKEDTPGMVDRLLEKHGPCIPHHDPRTYAAAAARTNSVAGYSILAFPDFWGHLPPCCQELMAERKPKVQRERVFEDILRYLHPEDLINKVVFDLEDPSHEYDLILNADANCSQHHQWFYFEVSGMKANVPYRFNIINCEKANSQFNYGMQPVLYSVREALEGKPHWVRAGSNICYYRNHFCPVHNQNGSSSAYYTLTFTVTFQHTDDVCYLAYHYPYTYSALQSHLQQLRKSVDQRKVFFQQQSLCNTIAGNPCPLVTITACPPSRSWRDLQQLRNRPYVVLTARVHPGESNASWVMKGTLEFLCSDDPAAKTLREAYIFKIIPMLNPDGVINGMHRCSLNGEDLNRQWMKPDPNLSPTIYHAKGLLYYLNTTGRSPLVFCDYHGHSRKKNVFLYGCSVKETLWQSGSAVDTASLKEDPGYRTISKTLDRIAPAFAFNSCNYLVEKSREATARVVVWREMGVLRSYTMESTYNGCDQGIFKGLQIGTRELEEMGMKFCQSLLSLRRSTMLYNRKLISQPCTLYDLDDKLQDHKSHKILEYEQVVDLEPATHSPMRSILYLLIPGLYRVCCPYLAMNIYINPICERLNSIEYSIAKMAC
uniref:AGBL carboxypeptidase 1 n=1 Tax=Scleropages formosus TaxID=113540 RepID=A0A8C9RZW6_SCLFO